MNLIEVCDKLLASVNDSLAHLPNDPLLPHSTVPLDDTLASIRPLGPSAWLQRAYYSLFQRNRSLKHRFAVLANSSLYLYTTDIPEEPALESVGLCPSCNIRVYEKGLFCLLLSCALCDYDQIELQFGDKDSMVQWLSLFRTALQQVKNGSTPLPLLSQTSSSSSVYSPLPAADPSILSSTPMSRTTPVDPRTSSSASSSGPDHHYTNPSKAKRQISSDLAALDYHHQQTSDNLFRQSDRLQQERKNEAKRIALLDQLENF
ncbi:MAG: hypothetical protein SGCHY_000964 [Lobulomycetales sp.]